MAKGQQLTKDQNARLRSLVHEELLARVPKQLHLAKLLGIPQGNLSKFLDGHLGATAPLVLRIAFLLNRSVEDVLRIPPPPDLADEQEWRYPSRILAARAAYLEGVPLSDVRAALSTSLHYDGDPGALWWLKMMSDGNLSKRGSRRDTARALKQVRTSWDKPPSKRRGSAKRGGARKQR